MGSLLVVLALGVSDFGRVLGTNAQIVNAARESVRQVTEYEHLNGTEPSFATLQSMVPTAANNEIGCNNCLQWKAWPASPPCPNAGSLSSPPLDPGAPLPSSWYPSSANANTGFIYFCSWKSAGTPLNTLDSKQHFEVAIAWRASLFTPLMQSIVGQPLLHGITDGTEP